MVAERRDLRSLLIGVLIGCGATVLFWPKGEEPSDAMQPRPQTEVALLGPDLPRQDPVRELPVARTVLESETMAPEEQAEEDEAAELEGFVDILPAALPSEAELMRRYGRMNLQELIGAEKSLNYVVHTEARAFLEQKMERGIFQTHVITVGTPLDQEGTFPDGQPRSVMTKYYPLGDGLQEVRLAEIHPAEQPILAARHAEIAWVSNRRQQLSQGLQD